MLKQNERGDRHIQSATDMIKGVKPLRELYRALYGTEPDRVELQRFTNRLNPARANPGAGMLGQCIEHLPELHEVTLKQFFGIGAGQGKPAPDTLTLVERARLFAVAAHAAVRQLRQFTDQPYSVHLAEVHALVAAVMPDERVQAAAWLHDVLEDTAVTEAVLAQEFGVEVADMVLALSDLSDPSSGRREERKYRYNHQLRAASADIQSIKVADIISNLSGFELLRQHKPAFSDRYRREKVLQLSFLTKANPALIEQARAVVAQVELAALKGNESTTETN